MQKKDLNESLISEERIKRDNDILKLNETVYGVLGKAWPSCRETQGNRVELCSKVSLNAKYLCHSVTALCLDKYCVEFVTRCGTMLPTQSTPIQISMLATLNLFVDKLALLKVSNSELTVKEKEMLDLVCVTLNKILNHSMGTCNYGFINAIEDTGEI